MKKKQALALSLAFTLTLGSALSGVFIVPAYEDTYEAEADDVALDDTGDWTDDASWNDADWGGTDGVIEAEEGVEEDYAYTENIYIDASEDPGSYEDGTGGSNDSADYEGDTAVEEGVEVEVGEEVEPYETYGDDTDSTVDPLLIVSAEDETAAEEPVEELIEDPSLETPDEKAPESSTYEEVLTAVEEAVEDILKEDASKEEASRSKSPGKKTRNMLSSNEGAEKALSMDSALFAQDDFVLVGASQEDEKLDFRELGFVGTAKDQGSTNSCWAYATVGALETGAVSALGKTAGEVDDSETGLVFFTHALRYGEGPIEYASVSGTIVDEMANPFLTGGLSNESAAFLVSSLGPAQENALPSMPHTEAQINEMAAAGSSYDWEDSSFFADHVVTNVAFLPEVNLRNEQGTWTGRDANGIKAIKKALSSGHAVVVEVFSPNPGSSYVNAEHNALCVTGNKVNSNHEVVIIGWDDSFSKMNFKESSRPQNDGAWICRNSWGSYETLSGTAKSDLLTQAYDNLDELWEAYKADGQVSSADSGLSDSQKAERIARWLYGRSSARAVDADGCFYMSYEDRAYNLPTAYDLAARDEVSDLTLYQYDYLGMASATGVAESESSGTVANIFKMKTTCDLKKVSVVTAEAVTNVTIDLYLLKKKAATPTDGKKIYSRTETLQWAGYHLLDLDQTLTLAKGSRVSVVVKAIGDSGKPYTPFEYGGNDPLSPEYAYIAADNEPGVSFILTGSAWTDLSKYEMNEEYTYLDDVKAGNALIKLFTGKASGEPIVITTPTPTPSPSAAPKVTVTPVPSVTPAVTPSTVSVSSRSFAPLYLTAGSSRKNKIKLRWEKQPEADGYTIYGAKKGKRMVKLKDLSGKKSSFTDKNLKKNTYYKYYIESYKMYGQERVVTAKSAIVFAVAKGGRYTNYKSVKLSSKSSVKLKVKETSVIKASCEKADSSAKVKKCASLRYESSNPAVAKVSKSGKITAKKKGKATIRVYAQNGVYKTVKVRVQS